MEFWTPIFCDHKGNRFVITHKDFVFSTQADAGKFGFHLAPTIWADTNAQFTLDVHHATDEIIPMVKATLTTHEGDDVEIAVLEGPLLDETRTKANEKKRVILGGD